MRILQSLFLSGIIVLLGASSLLALDVGKGTYYTKVNIWYENPQKIVYTNYHMGAIIPAGSKVEILGINGNKIKFNVNELKGMTFILTNIPKYSLVSTEVLFSDYFINEEVSPCKFNSSEKENISNGTIEEGMTKDAVIMSYGYPPKHKTPALSSNVWTYWDARATRKVVTFKDNKVKKIEEVNEYEEGRPYHPRWYHYVP